MEKLDLGLPLDWHPDGTPIFLRGDFIRDPRPVAPNGLYYDNLVLTEHRHLHPGLKFNFICIPPKINPNDSRSIWLGKSKPDKRRGFVFGRIIQALDRSCRVILQRWEEAGKITDFIVMTLLPFQFAVIPASYETILFNLTDNLPARFFEVHAKEEVRNLDSIKELGGPGYLLKDDGGLEPNINYDELPIPTFRPGLVEFKFLKRRSLYTQYTNLAKQFDFIDPPRDEFYIGSV